MSNPLIAQRVIKSRRVVGIKTSQKDTIPIQQPQQTIEVPKEEIKLEEIIQAIKPKEVKPEKEEIIADDKSKLIKLERLKTPKPPVMKVNQPQCMALTIKGHQCKYPVQPDQKMCTRHLKVFASQKAQMNSLAGKVIEKVEKPVEQKLEAEAVKQIIEIISTEQLPHPSQTESVPL